MITELTEEQQKQLIRAYNKIVNERNAKYKGAKEQ